MCSNGETPGPVMNSKWHGLANDIFNYMPDGISDIARNIHYIIERAFTSLPNAHPHERSVEHIQFIAEGNLLCPSY